MSPVNTDEIYRVPNHRIGTCTADTEACGRGQHQIKRSWTLMGLPLPWHTPLCPVWVTRATMQTAQTMLWPRSICCASGRPQVPHPFVRGNAGQTERAVWDETLNRSPRKFFCCVVSNVEELSVWCWLWCDGKSGDSEACSCLLLYK